MKFKKIASITINDAKWSIGYGYPGKTDGKTNDGICDYEKRRITISRGSTRNLLDVLAHEILHARFPDLTEESVNETAGIIDEAYGAFSKFQLARHGG
jgi:hypothetical protein